MIKTRTGIIPVSFIALGLIASCTQTGDNLENSVTPTSPQTAQTQTLETGTDPQPDSLAAETQPGASQNVVEQQITSINTGKTVAFLPVDGVPQPASGKLDKSLRNTARAKGVNVLPVTQSGAKYQIKGYLSALNDGGGTLLVYVWDVLDQSGKRVHRINGQEYSSSTNTDPWQSITDTELQKVANRTSESLKSWLEVTGS